MIQYNYCNVLWYQWWRVLRHAVRSLKILPLKIGEAPCSKCIKYLIHVLHVLQYLYLNRLYHITIAYLKLASRFLDSNKRFIKFLVCHNWNTQAYLATWPNLPCVTKKRIQYFTFSSMHHLADLENAQGCIKVTAWLTCYWFLVQKHAASLASQLSTHVKSTRMMSTRVKSTRVKSTRVKSTRMKKQSLQPSWSLDSLQH